MKIRFVKEGDLWLIQKRTWLRWKYIGYTVGTNGGSAWVEVYGRKKKETLNKALKILKLRKDTTKIIEYPTIKIY
jgi:hypothetical protein